MAEIEKISYCPHCGNNAPQKLVHTQLYSERAWSAEDGAEDKLPAAYFVAVCQTCHQLLLYGSTGISSEEAAFRQAGLVWPQSGRLHSAVPRTVAAIYTEAARIKSIAPNAFASQIRRALEAICEDRGARKQNLQASLKELADKGEIPPILAEAVDVLRLLGNVGAHAAHKSIHPLQVFEIDDFFRAIVEYIYVAQKKLEEFKSHLSDDKKTDPHLKYYDKSTGSRKEYFEKGMRDSAGGYWSPPHHHDNWGLHDRGQEDRHDDNEAYRAGWEHGKRDADDCRYDKGYDNC